jgi:penicillin-binding protein 1C
MTRHTHFSSAYFEVQSFLDDITQNDSLTIDKELTEKLRDIVKRNIDNLKFKNAKNAALVVIKLPENELLSLIGSPNPESIEEGYKINMLEQPRPIGSTIKPFIYLESFEKGLRPYTLVEDREYKYITALGFPLYPKNFDYKYRGEVNLHYALSNSLNVPAVKVLEYVGLEDFYNFLKKDLGLEPVQDLDNYQLGIALGSLEMSLLDLAKYFTIFPNSGILKELKISSNSLSSPEKEVAKPEYIQLVNKILNDRKTGVEQFGLKSELNLFQENYALKTGTSRNFKDSWIIG